VPGEPPVFWQPLAVEGASPLVVPQPLTVLLAVDTARSNAAVLAGQYEGMPWTIRPGTKLILDVGPNQEVVTGEPTGFAFDPATATGSFRIVTARPHAAGFLLTNTFLGNPGPQRRFDPREPAFASVVRYLSIIQ